MADPQLPTDLHAAGRSPAPAARFARGFLVLLSLLVSGHADAIEKMRPYQKPTYQSDRARTRVPESMTFEGYEFRLTAEETTEAGGEGEAAVVDAPPQALHGGITYWLFSDYIGRGINLSDYDGEGPESPVHQLTTSLEFDLATGFGRANEGEWGVVSLSTFFSWFPHNDRLTSEGSSFQEYDLYLTYSYEFVPLATTATFGTTFYVFPYGKEFNSVELLFRLDHNDAWAWKWLWPENEEGILNPYASYAADIDYINGGGWLEFGVSHDFPVIENLTVTPAFTLASDVRYLDRVVGSGEEGSIRLAYAQYALTVGYDLSAALQLPESAGSWTLSGFIYFNQALGEPKRQGLINDELFGGMSIGWSF